MATSINAGFIAGVEQAMNSSVAAVKSVTALMTADQQLGSCLARLEQQRARRMEEQEMGEEMQHNSQIDSILVEMVCTAFRSASVTVGIAAERAVAAAMIASQLFDAASEIADTAEAEVKAAARRQTQREECELDLNEEDKKTMSELRRKAAEDDASQREKAHQQKKKEEYDEKKEDESLKQDEAAQKGLARLRDKIKTLQVQLRLQHIRSLQVLNGETRVLQRQLQAQLLEMHVARNSPSPRDTGGDKEREGEKDRMRCCNSTSSVALLALVADCIDSSCVELRSDLSQLDLSENSSTSVDSSSSGSGSGSDDTAALELAKVARAVKRRLGWLSVLAGTKTDLINKDKDSVEKPAACTGEDAAASGTATDEVEPTDVDDDGVAEEAAERKDSAVDIDEGDASTDTSKNKTRVDSKDTSTSTKHQQQQQQPPRLKEQKQEAERPRLTLALLPDCRSRALWLCALLAPHDVGALVGLELNHRLRECLGLGQQGQGQSAAESSHVSCPPPPPHTTAPSSFVLSRDYDVALLIRNFCDGVLRGIKTVSDFVSEPQ